MLVVSEKPRYELASSLVYTTMPILPITPMVRVLDAEQRMELDFKNEVEFWLCWRIRLLLFYRPFAALRRLHINILCIP